MNAIKTTNFKFPFQIDKYEGKVRDVYNINEEILVIVATDRISAFDHILPNSIPFKGQVLNQTAAYFFDATKDLAPSHVLAVPDPNVTIGRKCKPYPIEVIVRAYLAGHAWREYQSGKRHICGVSIPEGLKENDPLPEPIITPTTKSMIGHDEDISEYEIVKSKILEPEEWEEMKHYAMSLFNKGTAMAKDRGLILVDTKYEFGYFDDEIYVIDEIHTPDSSRYFYQEGYEDRQSKGELQPQLSKEFVRKWLMSKGFQGKEGQDIPVMDLAFVNTVSNRYIELYETVTGEEFVKEEVQHWRERIMDNTLPVLQNLIS